MSEVCRQGVAYSGQDHKHVCGLPPGHLFLHRCGASNGCSYAWSSVDPAVPLVGDDEAAELKAENARLREALDLLRPAHHTPYVDEEHQGGNCVDTLMHLLARLTRAEQAKAAPTDTPDGPAAS